VLRDGRCLAARVPLHQHSAQLEQGLGALLQPCPVDKPWCPGRAQVPIHCCTGCMLHLHKTCCGSLSTPGAHTDYCCPVFGVCCRGTSHTMVCQESTLAASDWLAKGRLIYMAHPHAQPGYSANALP
jgi:hypothetical protein